MNPNFKKMLAARAITNKGYDVVRAEQVESERLWNTAEAIAARMEDAVQARAMRAQFNADVLAGMAPLEAVRKQLNSYLGV